MEISVLSNYKIPQILDQNGQIDAGCCRVGEVGGQIIRVGSVRLFTRTVSLVRTTKPVGREHSK